MAGPTPISPEEWQKLYPDAPTETPVERIGQGLGKAWDFMFGRDPSMVNGQPTPQQEQAPQLATAPSPSVPTGMDSPAAQPTGIFGPSMQTPSATSAFGALPTIVPDVQAGAGSLTGMAPMGVSGLPTEGTYQQPQGSTFIDATPQPTGAMGVGETRAMFGGRTLSQYLSDPTVKGAGLMTDPQGRMIDPNVDRSEYEELSAARSAAAGPNLTSIAGQPRPGVDVPSLAMQRERMAAGLDPVEGAPTGTGMSQQQQRDYLAAGRDPATGQPISTQDPLKQAQVDKTRAETASILSKIGATGRELNLTPAQEARDKAAGQALAAWDDGGRATVEGNIASLGDVIQGLETGQIKTRGFIDALPFGADWARAIMNPEAQDAKDRVQGVIFQTLRETLGAQFTEREGQRLVEASYNAKLSPEQNAARLRDYTSNLQRASQARETQLRYLNENGTLQGYQGPNPEEVMMEGYQGGAGGSPIKGDVNYASEADAILQGQ